MMEQVIAALQQEPRVHDWLAREVEVESTQLYLAGTEPEARRSVRERRVEVEVLNDHPAAQGGAPARGAASVTLLPGQESMAADRVAEAVFMASLSDNPPYSLPAPAVYPRVLTADRRLQVEPERAGQEVVAALLQAVAAEPGIALASAELFLDRTRSHLRSSRGVDATQEGTSLLLDVVLLARDGAAQEMEAHVEARYRAMENLDVADLVRRQARYARDTLVAQPPSTGRYPVIVSGEAWRDLLGAKGLSPFALRSGAQFKYQRLTPWEVGQSIFGEVEPTGDPLTVYANAVLPYGLHSAAFDREGLPGLRLPLIENGMLLRFWAGQRYADYLQIPATGAFGNLELAPGSLPFADMWAGSGSLLHVVAFSAMMPDPITGDFVGEIRLGYERRGGEMVPVKGGSLSGNLFAALATARLSTETVFLGDYFGPEAVRFPELTVSGAA